VTDISTFPDVEIELLSVLVPKFPSTRFVTKLPGTFTTAVTARIHRISGANRNIVIDRPIVDIDVFATSGEAAASSAARAIQAALLSLGGTQTTNGVIQRVTTVNGPRWLPEANQTLIRYGATYEVQIRAAT
jgi:ABC-type transport system involved in Fe-S cluster assembly fused permease/ATPase subunit